jgi:hypothetical protein
MFILAKVAAQVVIHLVHSCVVTIISHLEKLPRIIIVIIIVLDLFGRRHYNFFLRDGDFYLAAI